MSRFKVIQIIFAFSLFIAGTGVMFYPALSNQCSQRQQRRAIEEHKRKLNNNSPEIISICRREADQYNTRLFHTSQMTALLPDKLAGYDDMLNIDGSGVMGSITIEKVGVDLPINHYTTPSVLETGVGHLEGSSLPVGGKNTHCVLTAHRGLPGARLFTDLPMLDVGDIFTLHVLGEDLNYEIDQILTVLPTDMEKLRIVEGEDYCTLLTCTPYGINTHRLLVRGHRVP